MEHTPTPPRLLEEWGNITSAIGKERMNGLVVKKENEEQKKKRGEKWRKWEKQVGERYGVE